VVLDRVAVLQDVDLRRGRGHTFLDDPTAQESIDEGALAGIELADDHQQEQLVELFDRTGQRRLMLRSRSELREVGRYDRERQANAAKTFPGSVRPLRFAAAAYRDDTAEKLDAGLTLQRVWQDPRSIRSSREHLVDG
jgi:hypothetical protein